VIYTSGSTGTPKGAGDEHGGVANTLHGLQAAYDLRSGDRMLAISSLNYDMSVYEIFATLAAGACIVLPDDVQAADPELLLDLVIGAGVTTWSSAPAILDQLVNHARGRPGLPTLALRLVGLAGDRIPPALPGRLADLVPGVRLMNLAGMTEVSYCSMFYEVDTAGPPVSSVPWGRPVANHRLLILDDHGVPVPPGFPGELHIGGAGPGRGYWQRPSLTAQRFVPDPYAVVPGQRLYATGDHARFRSDGVVEFLGRLDRQIKIRGLRIEPGEIEVALAGHPAVAEAVVTVQRDRNDRQRLVSHLSVHGDAVPTTTELRDFLAGRLPPHMVPDAFVVLERFPLLPSGKLDRSALTLPVDRPALSTGYRPPGGDLEFVLCAIWSDVLDVEQVGVEDDFFDLGGHSLLATRVVSQIREVFRVNLPIPDLLGTGTVSELGERLRAVGSREGVDVDLVAELVRQVTGSAAGPAANHAGPVNSGRVGQYRS
jgi:amino acid adenylation domain-containing protein